MSRVGNAYRTHVNRDDVESGLGGALRYGSDTADLRLRAIGSEQVSKHALGRAAGERSHDGLRQDLGWASDQAGNRI